MPDPYIGELMLFAGNFAPRGWAQCDGQLLAITGNSALFSILDTTYGGDGRSTFGLPDLRGRVPVHVGSGPGLTPRNLGQKTGTESVTLSSSEMPGHTHEVACSNANGNSDDPTGRFPAKAAATGADVSDYADAKNTTMNAAMVENTGGGAAHNNMPPFQVLNWCIALVGIYPSRN